METTEIHKALQVNGKRLEVSGKQMVSEGNIRLLYFCTVKDNHWTAGHMVVLFL